MKQIALFLDGTWQDAADNTNISKMFNLITDDSVVKYYDAGVGTAKSWWDKVTGGLFGSGVQKNILQAYDFLRTNYEEGDEVFVFGFSRGAFTARSLVGFLDLVGLPGRHSQLSTKKLFNIYREKDYDTVGRLITTEQTDDVKVKMIGVFDTVKSIGSPINITGINKNWKFHNSSLCVNTENAFHAIAIDEERENFKAVYWTEKTESQHVSQRFFSGSHSDVGGGGDNIASIVPLSWMIRNAKECGLKIDMTQERANAKLPSLENSYDEMFYGMYSKISSPYSRPINSSILGLEIDYSVTHRLKNDSYKPVNLLNYLKTI